MILLLAGAHAVGKTFLGQPVAELLGIRHVTASALIREELGSANWDDSKRVQNVDKNQEALISAVSRIADSGGMLLLDGHFVLRNGVGGLVPLPVEVFKRLGINGTILLEAPANIVSSRLAERGASQSLTDIEELASAELVHAEQTCSVLGIPLIRLSSPTEDHLRSAIERLIS